MPLTDEQISKIEKYALEKYWTLDYTHGPNHGERTERLAEYIAKKEGADVQICKLGGLLHQYHPEGAWNVNRFLEEIGVDDKIRKQLVHCVECVELDTIKKATTLEAFVVFDADKLQVLGPFGLVREVAYRTLTKNIDYISAYKQAEDLQNQVIGHLRTKTAKEIASSLHDITDWVFYTLHEWETLSFLEYDKEE